MVLKIAERGRVQIHYNILWLNRGCRHVVRLSEEAEVGGVAAAGSDQVLGARV